MLSDYICVAAAECFTRTSACLGSQNGTILKCWDALKSYFLSQDETDVAKVIIQFVGNEEDSMTPGRAYLLFVSNILKTFHETILVLEDEKITAASLHGVMKKLLTAIEDNMKHEFFGYEVNRYLRSLPTAEAKRLKEDFLYFLRLSSSYLKKWYDFTDENYAAKLSCISLSQAPELDDIFKCVEFLGLTEINMDELYAEFLIVSKLFESLTSEAFLAMSDLNVGVKSLNELSLKGGH